MILVFVGAGGSAAVDPEQYPTTVEFFNRLPNDITGNGLFVKVREFLEAQKAGQPIDIEEVLWNLEDLRDYFQISRNREAIGGWIIAEHRINQLLADAPDLSPLLNGMSSLESQVRSLKGEINAQVYKFYAAAPESEKLQDWVKLLEGLAELDPTIEIFTTNYDRVLEQAIGEAGIGVKTGLKPRLDQMGLDTALWDSPGQPLDDNCGRLTKLHGSVSWQRSAEGIVVSNPIFTGDHQNHLILYPGYKGEPDQEPFIKFHEHLRTVAQRASVAIFVGFAFRDGYINDLLSALPSEIPTYIINKEESLPELPFTNVPKHFRGGFTAEAVIACLRSLQPPSPSRRSLADYDQVIADDPQNAEAYYNRGSAKYALEDYRGAITDYDKAIELNSQYAEAYHHRGFAKHTLGDYSEALADYNEAIELNSQYAEAYRDRGIAKRVLGDSADAEVDFAKASELGLSLNKNNT